MDSSFFAVIMTLIAQIQNHIHVVFLFISDKQTLFYLEYLHKKERISGISLSLDHSELTILEQPAYLSLIKLALFFSIV